MRPHEHMIELTCESSHPANSDARVPPAVGQRAPWECQRVEDTSDNRDPIQILVQKYNDEELYIIAQTHVRINRPSCLHTTSKFETQRAARHQPSRRWASPSLKEFKFVLVKLDNSTPFRRPNCICLPIDRLLMKLVRNNSPLALLADVDATVCGSRILRYNLKELRAGPEPSPRRSRLEMKCSS